MRRLLPAVMLLLMMALAPAPAAAQAPPCRDTLVRISDTVCEGTPFPFGDRLLTYSGIYYDTLPRRQGMCDSIVILTLSVLPPPQVQFYVHNICRGEVGYKLLLGSDGDVFRWRADPPDSSLAALSRATPGLRSVMINPRQPTLYYVSAGYGPQMMCLDSGKVSVTPLEPVTAALHVAPAEVSIDRLDLELSDQSIGNRDCEWGSCGREWYLGGSQIARWGATEQVRIALPPSDSLRVKVVAYTYTCSDSAVAVLPVRRQGLYFPNAFRPGAGEGGGRFAPVATGIAECEIWIYDRRGRLVHHGADAWQGWDGACGGAACPQGTYVYRCRYRESAHPAGEQSVAGTVLLLR